METAILAAPEKRDIIAAGELISSRPAYPYSEDTLVAFRSAHAWRDSHVEPMRAARRELRLFAARHGGGQITAARLKRMQSIRTKLRRTPLNLWQIQDIGGCRAIVPTMSAADELTRIYLDGSSKYEIQRPWDYVAQPKASGYRSRHIVVLVPPEGADHRQRRIELQVRTELQHVWATAVEAVGLFEGLDLKAGLGSPDWLRFFALMATEFAIEEDGPLVPGVPVDRRVRHDELGDIVRRLNAIAKLEGYNQAIKQVESLAGQRGESYLIHFDSASRTVRVSRNNRFGPWRDLEVQPGQDVVAVEVDQIGDLRHAYPNYFLDVNQFVERLRALMRVEKSERKARQKWGPLSWLKDYVPR